MEIHFQLHFFAIWSISFRVSHIFHKWSPVCWANKLQGIRDFCVGHPCLQTIFPFLMSMILRDTHTPATKKIIFFVSPIIENCSCNRKRKFYFLTIRESMQRTADKLLNCRRPGWLYSLVRREIVVRKNLTNFEGCHFARLYILIWWSFPKIVIKDFNSDSCFFKLVKLGTISPDAHFFNCVHIRGSQTIVAIFCGLSSGKRFVKLEEVF